MIKMDMNKYRCAALKILRKQFLDVGGLQSTLNVQQYDEKNETWQLSNVMENVIWPSVQIHFNGYNHWLTSQKDENGMVLVCHSLKSNRT